MIPRIFHQTNKRRCLVRMKRNDVLSIVKRSKLLILLFAASVFFACQPAKDNAIPDALIGMWVTSAPKYRDSFITFSEYYIIFGNVKESHILLYNIMSIKKASKNKDVLFTVSYRDMVGDDKDRILSFYYTPAKESPIKSDQAKNSQIKSGVLRLTNKNNIKWKKLKELK